MMIKETFKVVCISAEHNRKITIGKIYDAYYDRDPKFYFIKNDDEIWVAYFAYKFISLADWRDIQIDKILNDE